MAIRYRCRCGANIRMPVSVAGKRARCRSCGAVFTVPAREHEPTNKAIGGEPAGGVRQANASDESYGWLEEFSKSEAEATGASPAPIITEASEAIDLSEVRPPPPADDDYPSADERRSWITGPRKPFWRDLLESFVFFLDARNFITFTFIVLLIVVPKLLPLPIIGWVLGVLASLYVCAFFLNIVRESASGEDELPNVWIGSVWDDVILPLVRFFGTWVWVLLPAIAVALLGRGAYGSIPWAAVKSLVVVGLFFWPAVVLGVSIGDSFSGLWPHVVVRTAFAAPLAYLAVCGAVAAAAGIMFLPEMPVFVSLVSKLPRSPTRVVESISAALTVYAIIVAMRVIGLFYRHYKHRLPWVAE